MSNSQHEQQIVRLEHENRQLRDLTTTILDTIEALIIVLTPSGQLVRCNRACERLSGYTQAQLSGRALWDMFMGEQASAAAQAIFEQIVGGTYPLSCESTWRTRSGQLRLIDWIYTAICDDTGQPQTIIGMGQDITRKRQLEQELRSQRDHALQLSHQLQASLTRTEALYAITRTIMSEQPLARQLEQIVQQIAATFTADRVTLIAVDQQSAAVTAFVGAGAGMGAIAHVDYAELMAGLTGWVLRTGQLALSPQGAADPRESPHVQARRQATNCGAIMVAPLSSAAQTLGTLTLINSPGQPDWSQQDSELLTIIAQQIASALAHEQAAQRLYLAPISNIPAASESGPIPAA